MFTQGSVGFRSYCPVAQRWLSNSIPTLANVSSQITQSSEAAGILQNYTGYLTGAINSILAKTANATGIFALKSFTDVDHAKSAITETFKSGIPTNTEVTSYTYEKRISRTEVTKKTRALVEKLLSSESNESKLINIRELSSHIINYPPTRIVAAQAIILVLLSALSNELFQYPRLIADLLKTVKSFDTQAGLRGEARLCLTLCGCQPAVKSRGINLLSIDGGGTRGLMGLEVLEQLEKISGKKICELFDHVVGVSTGSIIASLLIGKGYTVEDCRTIYVDVSKRLFSQNRLSGVSGVVLNHSYYDTKKWVKMLKETIGEELTLIDTSKESVPRLSIVAAIVNFPVIQPYVFRNYEPPAGRDSHYRGSTGHYLWKAIQASAAAPLYFEEVKLDHLLLQDGGVVANNPTAIGIHEAKLLWPEERLHCVVSVGNGRSVCDFEPKSLLSSLSSLQKFNRIIDSATNTEAVHMCMHDLLDENVYFRLNPYMSVPYSLDEIDPQKIEQMRRDAKLYVRRNMSKIEDASARLLQKPTIVQLNTRRFDAWMDGKGLYSRR
ncbi:phospholipase, patatin family [Dictyocaulus viviparus]|uniref:Phospholipase, patatin family n=1 Tax=Dictyocaulus viviparus TaxID=29172 RepID=A0A0D8XZ31_DICVI|nr:phospholipase, patatin family [Dictyocaulus viviparus]